VRFYIESCSAVRVGERESWWICKQLTVREQAEEYVKRVGTIEARNSNHYRTAGICHCGTCFCCEVVKAVAREQRKQVAS
jgi:hypothetical protein